MTTEKPFDGRTDLGLRTVVGPGGITTTPTREAPPPVQDQAIKEALKEALGDSGDVFKKPIKDRQNRRLKVLISRGILAGLALTGIGVGVKALSDNEPTPPPQTSSADFPNSFTDKRLVPKTEAEIIKVKPKDVFDNTATKGIFTEQNSVAMTPKQYQDTLPQLIDGDSVIIPLSIELPEGAMPKVHLKKEKGGIFGGKRHINGRMENGKFVSDGTVTVNDVLTISGVPEGSVFLSPFDGEIRFSTSSGYGNPDGTLKLAAFFLNSEGSNGNGISLTVSTVKLKPLIEPSRIEYEEGTNRTKPTPRQPIKAGDPIGIISTTTHDNPHYNGQIHISATSRVVEDGQVPRGGPAELQLATTPEGKVIMLKRSPEPK